MNQKMDFWANRVFESLRVKGEIVLILIDSFNRARKLKKTAGSSCWQRLELLLHIFDTEFCNKFRGFQVERVSDCSLLQVTYMILFYQINILYVHMYL